ncbi:MAG: IS200/IS605 family transposase [Desulfuromonadaceae bacterium]
MEYKRDEHRVHLIVYHLIFCPKRRRKILKDAIASDCEALIKEVCETKGWEILELAIQPDHVHLFVRCWPSDSAAEVVGTIKGRTSHDLRGKYPELLKMPSLWTRSYFASTAGNVSSETIQKYIEAQKGI